MGLRESKKDNSQPGTQHPGIGSLERLIAQTRAKLETKAHGSLVREFEKKKRVYVAKKRQHSEKSEYERVLKIKAFLRYCENKGIRRIKNITQIEYDNFAKDVLSQKSTETKRKYLYALKEFFTRAHLDIKVNTQKAVQRAKEKKLNRILKILSIEITEEQKEKILNLL